jgi:hypothetical protein
MPEEHEDDEDIDSRFLRSPAYRLEILAFLESEAGMALLSYIGRSAPVQPIQHCEPEMWMQIRKDAYARGWLGALHCIQRLPEEMAARIVGSDGQPAAAEFVADPDLPDYLEDVNY